MLIAVTELHSAFKALALVEDDELMDILSTVAARSCKQSSHEETAIASKAPHNNI